MRLFSKIILSSPSPFHPLSLFRVRLEKNALIIINQINDSDIYLSEYFFYFVIYTHTYCTGLINQFDDWLISIYLFWSVKKHLAYSSFAHSRSFIDVKTDIFLFRTFPTHIHLCNENLIKKENYFNFCPLFEWWTFCGQTFFLSNFRSKILTPFFSESSFLAFKLFSLSLFTFLRVPFNWNFCCSITPIGSALFLLWYTLHHRVLKSVMLSTPIYRSDPPYLIQTWLFFFWLANQFWYRSFNTCIPP